MYFPRVAILLSTALLLAACKAEEIEIKLSGEDVVAAAAGESVMVEFEAEFGERFTTVDDEKREMLEAIRISLQRYFPEADIELSIGSDGYSFDLEGEVLVSNQTPDQGTPWYVSAVIDSDGTGILVSLQPSATFGPFKNELEDINSMIGPSEFQPVEFRFSADRGTVLVGGAYVDGRAEPFASLPMAGDTKRMRFSGGVWEDTGGGFLYLPGQE